MAWTCARFRRALHIATTTGCCGDVGASKPLASTPTNHQTREGLYSTVVATYGGCGAKALRATNAADTVRVVSYFAFLLVCKLSYLVIQGRITLYFHSLNTLLKIFVQSELHIAGVQNHGPTASNEVLSQYAWQQCDLGCFRYLEVPQRRHCRQVVRLVSSGKNCAIRVCKYNNGHTTKRHAARLSKDTLLHIKSFAHQSSGVCTRGLVHNLAFFRLSHEGVAVPRWSHDESRPRAPIAYYCSSDVTALHNI